MKKGFMISAAVLIGAGAILFTAAFIASGFDFSKLDTAKYETNTYIVSKGFETIELRSDEADITFKQSEDGTVRVDCVEQEKAKHAVCVESGALKIIAADNRAWYDHLALFSFKRRSITIYLPFGYYKALTVNTSTGDVFVPETFSFGGLKIKTSTGDIRIDGVRADTIDLSVSTGRITGKNVNCKETLSVEVGTGKTVLTDVACKSLVSTGSTGDVTLKNVVATEDFNIERSTADVRFESCDAGRITVKTSTGNVSGTLLTEKVFITKTSTGDIDVPDTTSGGSCKITTSTGDIRLAVKNEPLK